MVDIVIDELIDFVRLCIEVSNIDSWLVTGAL